MSKTITSGSLTFIDTTDTKKIDVHISSNHPTAQIFDVNKGTFTPNWNPNETVDGVAGIPLELSVKVFADSIDVTNSATIKWFKDSKDTPELTTTTISANMSESMATYICAVEYNNKDYDGQITFTRITTGKNGLNGQPGKNGEDGKNGTSVNIQGTAYAKSTPITGSTLKLYSDAYTTNEIAGADGDAYLVDGYLCVYNKTDNNFICTGKIQGPKGEQGDSSFLFIRYAEDQYGTNMTSSPGAKTTHIGFYRTTVNEAPTNPAQIKEWIKFIGTPASLVNITPSALYFKSTEGKDGIFTPEHIYLYPRFQTVAYDKWQYSIDGGINWSDVDGVDGLAIDTFNSVPHTLQISRESSLYTDTVTSISFRCLSSNNTIYNTVSVAKIYDVADLSIGGRNLARYTDSDKWQSYGFTTVNFSDGVRSKRIKVMSKTTDSSDVALFGIEQTAVSRTMKLKSGQKYTLSFFIRGNVTNLSGSRIMHLGENSTYQDVGGIVLPDISETEFIKVSKTFIVDTGADSSAGSYLMIAHKGVKDETLWFEIEEIQLEAGQVATDWSPALEDLQSVTFQIYAPKGFLITSDMPEVTLETFAYDGNQLITDATFVWYSWNEESWSIINETSDTSLVLNKSNVLKTNVYKCEMTYKDQTYEATATVEDKTDVYESLIRVIAKQSSANRMYWILYATIYSEDGEHDTLLGPISETAPENPIDGDYWYEINSTDYTVTLMKYSNGVWETTIDTQELLYDWTLVKDSTDIVTLGSQNKVKIITANDFYRVCNVQCHIFNADNVLFARSSQVLNDPSDPIISATEPPNPIDKQLWIKVADNGTYVISIWNEETRRWMVSDVDSQNKIHTEKPARYAAGDIWIVGGDFQPIIYTNGVATDIKYSTGTMLKAQSVSETYLDSDWVEALNYKESIDDLKDQLNIYNQYFSFDETGITMTAKNFSGEISDFKTKLTNTELGFYQGENKVAHINDNQLNISKAEITNGLKVTGTQDAPATLSIGGFALVIESNGSLSIGYNT